MTEIKNGRLILSPVASVGMLILSVAAFLLVFFTVRTDSLISRIIYGLIFILIILSAVTSTYMGDYKKYKKKGLIANGEKVKPVMSICEKEAGFLLGFLITFIIGIPLILLSVYYYFKK